MSFLSLLQSGIKKLHDEVDNLPYLLRYKNADEMTLLDHYRHLRQLQMIYETIELQLKKANPGIVIPSQFDYLKNRSREILSDLKFLEKYVHGNKKNEILSETQAYVDQLLKIDVNEQDGFNRIFAHFLTRILGDLFGGQKVKKDVQAIYQKSHLSSSSSYPLLRSIFNEDEGKGVHFYTFKKNTLKDILQWLNKANVDAEVIVPHANASLAAHAKIFKELESTRDAAVLESKQATKKSATQNTCNFFVAATIVAGITVVATATNYYTSKYQ